MLNRHVPFLPPKRHQSHDQIFSAPNSICVFCCPSKYEGCQLRPKENVFTCVLLDHTLFSRIVQTCSVIGIPYRNTMLKRPVVERPKSVKSNACGAIAAAALAGLLSVGSSLQQNVSSLDRNVMGCKHLPVGRGRGRGRDRSGVSRGRATRGRGDRGCRSRRRSWSWSWSCFRERLNLDAHYIASV